MTDWVYHQGTPVKHLGCKLTTAHSPPLEQVCFMNTPRVPFDMILWLLNVCCSLHTLRIGPQTGQYGLAKMSLILRALKNQKVVLFDCTLMEDDPSLPKKTVTEQTMRLWSQMDQPPFLNVKGEKVQFGTQIKNFYCNRSVSTVPCKFLKDVDPVCLFNRPVGKWTPVTPEKETTTKSPPRKRKTSSRPSSDQGKGSGMSNSLAHYTIPKRSKTVPQEEPKMVSVLRPLCTSVLQNPSAFSTGVRPDVMSPPSPSEYLNKHLPTNQSPLAKRMALQQHVSSQEPITAESILIQDSAISASESPPTPDLFDPQ